MRSHSKRIKWTLPLLLLPIGLFAAAGLTMSQGEEARAEETGVFAVSEGATYRAYATFDEALSRASAGTGGAKEIYAVAGAEIEISATVTLTSDVILGSIAYDGIWGEAKTPAVLVRAESFTGAFFDVKEGASLTMKNITIDGAGTAQTAALRTEGELLLGEGVTVRNNSSASLGGAVYVSGMGASVTLDGATISGNTALAGAGVYAEKGASFVLENGLITENVSTEEKGAVAAKDGAFVTVSGGRITVPGEGKNAVYLYGGETPGNIRIEGRPALGSGAVFLENGAILDVTGYDNNPINVAVQEDRPDGAVAVRKGTSTLKWEELVTLSEPQITETYLEAYPYRARYTRAVATADGEEYGYGGLGVNVSQEKSRRLIFTARFTDPAADPVLIMDGKSMPLTASGEDYTAEFDLSMTNAGDWTVKTGSVERQFPAVEIVRIGDDGTVTAPDGTEYADTAGARKPFTGGLVPNDLGIDEEGLATFYVKGQDPESSGKYARKVFVGKREAPVDRELAGGAIYDAENTDTFGVAIRFRGDGEGRYEYALLDETGNIVTQWAKAEQGIVKFGGLEPGSLYTLIARTPRPDNGYTLPGAYIELSEERTLTIEENNARYAFFSAYQKLLGSGAVRADVTVELMKHALTAYDALSRGDESLRRIAEFPALLEWLDVIRGSLHLAFVNQWKSDNRQLLEAEIDTFIDTSPATYRPLCDVAARSYHGMEDAIREALGECLTSSGIIPADVAAAAKELLETYMTENVMPKARRVAALDVVNNETASIEKYGLSRETTSERVDRIHDVTNEYVQAGGKIESVSGMDLAALDEIYRLRDTATVRIATQAYYERLTLDKEGTEYAPELLSETLNSVMVRLSALSSSGYDGETFADMPAAFLSAQFGGMLEIYQSYARAWLKGLFRDPLPASLLEELYQGELARISAVTLSASSDEALSAAEDTIDGILGQAASKHELQLYYEGLLPAQTDGRLSVGMLTDGEDKNALIGTLRNRLNAFDNEEEDALGRILQEGKAAVYEQLASLLLAETYAAEYEATAGLTALFEAEKTAIGGIAAGDADAVEDSVERAYEGAKLKLKVRAYFEKFTQNVPEESRLETIYSSIDGAASDGHGADMVSAKTAEAYRGMLSLYKRSAALLLDAYETAYETVTEKETFLSAARTGVEGVVYEAPFTDETLARSEAEIDAITETARCKLEVQGYYEMLIARDGTAASSLAGPRTQTFTAVEQAPLGEKEGAAYQGKRNLYAAFTAAVLHAFLEETYPDADKTLTAFETEALDRLAEVDFAGTYSEELLAALTSQMDAVRFSAVWKLALRSYFNQKTADGMPAEGFAAALEATLNEGLAAVDEATMSEKEPFDSLKEAAAYRGMLAFTVNYAGLALEEIASSYEPLSEALGAIVNDAKTKLALLGFETENYAAELTELEQAAETYLWNADASLLLTAYRETLSYAIDGVLSGLNEAHARALSETLASLLSEVCALRDNGEKHAAAEQKKSDLFDAYAALVYEEFTEKFPASARSFEEVGADDAEIDAAYQAFETLAKDTGLAQYFAEQAPEYENTLGYNAFALKLADYERKAKVEARRTEVLAAIDSHCAQEPQSGDLTDSLAAIRTEKKEQANAAADSYEQFSESGKNSDPLSTEYMESVLAELDKIVAQAKDSIEDTIGLSEIAALESALSEEIASYTKSHLAEMKKDAVTVAVQAAVRAAKDAVNADGTGSLAVARAHCLTIRKAYAKAVADGYATVLGRTAEYGAIDTSETDGAIGEAMFEALLSLYRSYAMDGLAEAGAYREEAETRLNSLVFEKGPDAKSPDDAALAGLEAEADGFAEAAVQKAALTAYSDALCTAEGLTDELAKQLQTALETIDAAEKGKRAEAALTGMRALTKAALDRYAGILKARETGLDTDFASVISGADSAIDSADEASMLAILLAKEHELLTLYAQRVIGRYTPAEDDTALAEALTQRLNAAAEAIPDEGPILPSDAAAEAALRSLAADVVEIFSQDMARELGESSIKTAVKEKADALAEALPDSDADAATETVRTLILFYADAVLSDIRKENDPQSVQTLAETARTQISEAVRESAPDTALQTTYGLLAELRTAAQGERLLNASSYPDKAFDALTPSDADALVAAKKAYDALTDEGVRSYLDESMKGGYADFGARLTDELEKARFEALREKTIADIGALSSDSDSELVSSCKETHTARAEELEYLSATAEREADYFNTQCAALGNILEDAQLGVRVALTQESRLGALKAAYDARLADSSVRYSDAGLDNLETIYETAKAKILAVEAAEGADREAAYAQAETELDTLLRDARASLATAPVIAVAKGLKGDGSGAYEEGHPEDDFYGIVENEGGMPGNAVLKISVLTENLTVKVHEAVRKGDLVGSLGLELMKKLVGDKEVKVALSIELENVAQWKGEYTVKILLTPALKKAILPQLVGFTSDGKLEVFETSVEGEFLVFKTAHFSEFQILGEVELNLWWLICVLVFVLLIELAVILYLSHKLVNRRNERQSESLASFGLPVLLTILIPSGTVVVSIVLGVLIVLAAAAIVTLLVLDRSSAQAKAGKSRAEELHEEDEGGEEANAADAADTVEETGVEIADGAQGEQSEADGQGGKETEREYYFFFGSDSEPEGESNIPDTIDGVVQWLEDTCYPERKPAEEAEEAPEEESEEAAEAETNEEPMESEEGTMSEEEPTEKPLAEERNPAEGNDSSDRNDPAGETDFIETEEGASDAMNDACPTYEEGKDLLGDAIPATPNEEADFEASDNVEPEEFPDSAPDEMQLSLFDEPQEAEPSEEVTADEETADEAEQLSFLDAIPVFEEETEPAEAPAPTEDVPAEDFASLPILNWQTEPEENEEPELLPSEGPVEESIETPVEESVEQPVEEAPQEPVQESPEETVGEPVGESAETSVEEAPEEPEESAASESDPSFEDKVAMRVVEMLRDQGLVAAAPAETAGPEQSEPVQEPEVELQSEEAPQTEEEPTMSEDAVLESAISDDQTEELPAPAEEFMEEARAEMPEEVEPTEYPTEQPTEQPTEEPIIEPLFIEPEETSIEEPKEPDEIEPVEEPIEQSDEIEPVEEPIEQPEEIELAEEPIDQPEEIEPVEEPIEQPEEIEPIIEPLFIEAEEPAEEPETPATEHIESVQESVEEPIEQPIEEPVQELTGEPVQESAEEPSAAPVREEVAASEVNALMTDSAAKKLIVESKRIANKSKSVIVNVDTLGEFFEDGETVNLEALKKRVPYISKKATYIKVLARGRLGKALTVEGDDFSLEAVKMIVLTGGTVIRTCRK